MPILSSEIRRGGLDSISLFSCLRRHADVLYYIEFRLQMWSRAPGSALELRK